MSVHAFKTGLYNAAWGAVGAVGASTALVIGASQGAVTGAITGAAHRLYQQPQLFSALKDGVSAVFSRIEATVNNGNSWVDYGKTLFATKNAFPALKAVVTDATTGAKMGATLGGVVATAATSAALTAVPLPPLEQRLGPKRREIIQCDKRAIGSGMLLGTLAAAAFLLFRGRTTSDLHATASTMFQISASVGALTAGSIAAIRA